jgi:hypothetical protein
LAAGNTSGANNLIIDNGQAITTNTINETTAASGVTIDSVLLKDDGVNATNLEITNIKANDGTSAGSIADSTGIVTLASSVLTTADINGGTIDGTTLGATTPASVAATTLSTTGAATFSGDVGIGGAPLANNQLLLTDAGTYSQFHMQNSTSGSGASDGFRILMDGVNTTITNHETGYMAFETQNTERLRIDSAGAATFSGAVTIGSATGQNSVFGTIIGSGGANEGAVIVSSATGKGWLGFNNGNNASIPGQLTYDHATNVLSLYSSGTVSVTGAATFSGAVESTKFNTAADRAVLDAPSGDGRFRVSTNSTTYGFFRANTSVIQIGTDSVEPLDFHTNNVFRMRLDGNGNFLVGHTAQVLSSKVLSQFSGATHNGIIINETADTASTTFAAFSLSGTAIGSITRVGATSAVAYNTTSDERLKSNIANSDPVLEKIMQVQVRQYDWTEGNLHQDYGFIAQELAPVLSGIVTEGKEEADMWQLDYSRLTPALLKAIQEQQAIIESLTARIEALEGAK